MGPYVQPQFIVEAQCLEGAAYAYTTGIVLGLVLGLAFIFMVVPLMEVTIKALRIGGRWLWLRRKAVFRTSALIIILLFPGQANAQWFFPCGGNVCQAEEIPVKDSKTRTETALTAVKATLLLVDALKQALTKDGLWDHRTGNLLSEIAIYTAGEGSILYGQDGSSVWPTIYQFDSTWENGEWLESELVRDRASLWTQRSLMRHLELMRAEDAADEEEIEALQARVDNAKGRNEIEQAAAAVNAKKLHEERKTRAVLLAIANGQFVQNGYEVNKDAAPKAQERYFATNGDRPVPFPDFEELGL